MSSLSGQFENGGATARQRRLPLQAVFNVGLFVVFAGLWASFSLAIVLGAHQLDEIWKEFRDLHVTGQALLALLFLPLIAGLWIWETPWPATVRLALVAGLAWWNIVVFWPFHK
jgi:hypothetical protein